MTYDGLMKPSGKVGSLMGSVESRAANNCHSVPIGLHKSGLDSVKQIAHDDAFSSVDSCPANLARRFARDNPTNLKFSSVPSYPVSMVPLAVPLEQDGKKYATLDILGSKNQSRLLNDDRAHTERNDEYLNDEQARMAPLVEHGNPTEDDEYQNGANAPQSYTDVNTDANRGKKKPRTSTKPPSPAIGDPGKYVCLAPNGRARRSTFVLLQILSRASTS